MECCLLGKVIVRGGMNWEIKYLFQHACVIPARIDT